MPRTSTPSTGSAHQDDAAWPGAPLCEVVREAPGPDGRGQPADKGRGTILVLPGNPGVPGYYRRFARGLADELGVEVAVLGFRGHTLRPRAAPWEVFSLEDQIEHVLGYIDHAHGDGPLSIVGHSIGGYIALEALRQRPKTVNCAIGLLPFLENNDGNSSFARLALLVLLPAPLFWLVLGLLCAVLALVERLPLQLRKLILHVSGQTRGFDPEWVDFTADAMLQPSVFANYAFMGRTELRHHAPRYDFGASLGDDSLAGRARLLYTDNDFWAPEALVPSAQAAGISTEMHKGLQHTFSTRAASCDWVTTWVSQQLRQMGIGAS
mmetsp:Transcript_130734/g.406527  ORF Transcript_130734/g.406527 Transcript_130734/m.406527 type:complete len:323 (-) Transcript_130734:17-985(-)